MGQSYFYTLVHWDEYQAIKKHADNACIGGQSHIRQMADRKRNLSEDQFVGQLGEFALSRWFGLEDQYFARREQKDLNPYEGDKGYDIFDYPVDIKTSLMRRSKMPMTYHLLVRPAERHDDHVYVLALVKQLESPPVTVYLVGWARDEELPPTVERGAFKGAHCLKANKLRPMDSLVLGRTGARMITT